MADLVGKWAFDHGENMQTLVEKLNIKPEKIPQDTSSTVEIQKSGNSFTIKTAGGGKSRDVTFTLGTPFVDQDILEIRGKEITVTPALEGNRLVLSGAKGNSVVREVVGGQMVITFNWEGIVGKRYFNKA